MTDVHAAASDETSIPENTQLAQWHDEAAAAAGAPDLRERVRALAVRALSERRMDIQELRQLIGAVTAGVGSGLSDRRGDMAEGLRQAVSGLDDALGAAAQRVSYTLREAADQGRAFKDHELKSSLEQLRDLEAQFIETLRQTASQSRGQLRDELNRLAEHLRNSGTHTGEQVRDAFFQLAHGVRATRDAGREGLVQAAATATARLADVASGVFAAVSDALKERSDRLRS